MNGKCIAKGRIVLGMILQAQDIPSLKLRYQILLSKGLKIKVTSITLYDGLSLSKSPAAQKKVNNSVTNQDVNYTLAKLFVQKQITKLLNNQTQH